jgi:sulfur carrier protein ThiS
MATITFRAFSQLRQAFHDKGVVSTKALEIPDAINVVELIRLYGFDEGDIEAVFINHKVVPKETIIQDGDRVSLIPPGGIPGHVAGYIGKKGIE